MNAVSPLTEAQSGLWFAQRLDPGNPIFNTAHFFDMKGPLDRAAFSAAVDQTMQESDALALHFTESMDGAVQRVADANRPSLNYIDLSNAKDPEGAAREAMQRDMNTPVDPTREKLAALTLYKIGPERHIWYLRVHHLAADGYGMALIAKRVAELYNQAANSKALAPLQPVWAEDAAYRDSPARGNDADYWRTALAGMEDVVGMAPGRAMTAHSCHRIDSSLPRETQVKLLALAARANVSWPDAVTALVAAYCQRFSATAEITVGVPYMGRMGSASARVPAMIMNVLPLRVMPDEDAPMADFLVAVDGKTGVRRVGGPVAGDFMGGDSSFALTNWSAADPEATMWVNVNVSGIQIISTFVVRKENG